jgi:hypothetical protein
MCAPVSVATGGASGGCSGLCQVMPQLLASLGVLGVLIWNFKGLVVRYWPFTRLA